MNTFVIPSRSIYFEQFFCFSAIRLFRTIIAASILLFAGNAHAVISVGLSIENDLDSNDDITVINGGKVKVAYTVIQDDDKDLNKKDKIQLVRVSDDKVIDSVDRGKKKSGTVSLKVKNSEGEQLYVRYIRKVSGTEITRTSHPDDAGFIALLSIAKKSVAELTSGQNALESRVSDNETNIAANTSSIQANTARITGTFYHAIPPNSCTGDDLFDGCTGGGHDRTESGTQHPCAAFLPSGNDRGTFTCALNLPDGVALEEVVMFGADNNISGYYEGVLFRVANNTFGTSSISSNGNTWQSSGLATTGVTSVTLLPLSDPDHIVDNQNNRYVIAFGGRNARVHTIRVRYRVD